MSKGFNGSILLLSAMILFINGCDSDTSEGMMEKPLRPVRTMLIEKPDSARVHKFSAVVEASRKADLSFKVHGEIIKILVKPGDKVSTGQVLAKLDDTDLKIERDTVRVSFDNAKADYVRAQTLIKTDVISRSDFDKLKAKFDSANASLEGAENNLSYSELKAPFTGIIAKQYIQNFEEISAKQAIFVLHVLNTINLKVDVPETIMLRLQKNTKPANLRASFDAIPGMSFPLKFKEIATQPDEVTKTYELILSMESPKGQTILPGMVAQVMAEKLLAEDLQPQYYLPANSVLKDSEGNFIYTVISGEKGTGSIVRKAITIGEITQLGIEIFSGINEGDHVLTAGMSKVTEGMQVKF